MKRLFASLVMSILFLLPMVAAQFTPPTMVTINFKLYMPYTEGNLTLNDPYCLVMLLDYQKNIMGQTDSIINGTAVIQIEHAVGNAFVTTAWIDGAKDISDQYVQIQNNTAEVLMAPGEEMLGGLFHDGGLMAGAFFSFDIIRFFSLSISSLFNGALGAKIIAAVFLAISSFVVFGAFKLISATVRGFVGIGKSVASDLGNVKLGLKRKKKEEKSRWL